MIHNPKQKSSKDNGISLFAKTVKESFIKEKKTGIIFIHSPWAFEGFPDILDSYCDKIAAYEGYYASVGITEVPEVTSFFSSRKIRVGTLPAIIEYHGGRCVSVHSGLAQFNAYLTYGDIINGNRPRDYSRNSHTSNSPGRSNKKPYRKG